MYTEKTGSDTFSIQGLSRFDLLIMKEALVSLKTNSLKDQECLSPARQRTERIYKSIEVIGKAENLGLL